MPRYRKEQIRAALEQTQGMRYLAATQVLHCSYTTMEAWLRRCPDLEEYRRTLDGAVTDTAELKLHQKILAGEAWAVQFQLRTKGKDRGYGEGVAVTDADGKPLLPVQIPSEPSRIMLIMQIIQQIAPSLTASLVDGDGNEPDNGHKLLAG